MANDDGLLTEEQSKGFAVLQSFFDLEPALYHRMHASNMATSYQAVVTAALAASEVLSSATLSTLAGTRTRALISESDAKGIFDAAMAEKVGPVIKDIVKNYAAANDKKDKSPSPGDPTNETVAKECLKLLDYFLANGVVVQTPGVGEEEVTVTKMEKKTRPATRTKKRRVSGGATQNGKKVMEEYEETYQEEYEEEVTSTEMVAKVKNTFPLNGIGIRAITADGAAALYRNLIVTSFQGGDLADEIEGKAVDFGMAMGIKEPELKKIDGSIGAQVFDNYFTTSMKGKTAMDQSDFMFMAQIKEKLNMSESQMEKLLASTNRNVLSKNLEMVFVAGTNIKAASVTAVREQAAGMGLDFKKDLGVDDDRLTRMFRIEVGQSIESGIFTAEDGGEKIADICDALGMTMEEGEEMLEALVMKRAGEIMKDVSADVTRGNDERAMKDLALYLRYIEFVGGASMNTGVSILERDRIVATYRAFTFGKDGSDESCTLLEASLTPPSLQELAEMS